MEIFGGLEIKNKKKMKVIMTCRRMISYSAVCEMSEENFEILRKLDGADVSREVGIAFDIINDEIDDCCAIDGDDEFLDFEISEMME